jgi:hypothetical protein
LLSEFSSVTSIKAIPIFIKVVKLLRFAFCSRDSCQVFVTVMTLTGQESAAFSASDIFSSLKVPTDLPLLVPPTTLDLPSGSLSKWFGSSP